MPEPWSVTTWNLQGSASPSITHVAQVVRDLAPDVLALQEVRRAQCRRLASILGWRRTWHRKHHPYSPLVWWRTEGMAILTPHRLGRATSICLTPDVSTWTYRHRIAVVTTVRRGHDRIDVVDLHLASDADGAHDRRHQADLVRAIVDDLLHPVVIAGDLNDHGDDGVVQAIAGATHVDAWVAAPHRSAGGGATNPSGAPHQRLDHVLVPTGATCTTAEVPAGGASWAEMSDHLPLTVSFTVEASDAQPHANGPDQMRSQ